MLLLLSLLLFEGHSTLWTVAHQAPWSMGFSRQEYWSGLPRPSPGDLPDPGIEPMSFMSKIIFFKVPLEYSNQYNEGFEDLCINSKARETEEV